KLWDYHKYPFNFEGRIALRPSVRFGLLGAGMFYFALPLYDKFVKMKNQKVCNIITAVAVGLFVIDLLFRIKYGNNYTCPA
ncbi:MAG: putative ABC transporter permease, partial [Clostridia bacterium]|nr:putative ABC transporter permease [Clostridia bacterium]